MMRLLKRHKLYIFVLFFLMMFVPSKAYADFGQAIGTAAYQVIDQMFNGVDSADMTGRVFTQAMIVDPLSQALTGCPTGAIVEYLQDGNLTCNMSITGYGSTSGGLPNVGLLSLAANGYQGAIDTPPAVNMASYYKTLKAESLVFKEAEAQASVFEGFNAIVNVWRGMRNISYGVLAVFVMAIAVMIVLRQKVDAQTQVSAQLAIPRLFISAILITFSYPLGSAFAMAIQPLTRVVFYLLGRGNLLNTVNFSAACPSLGAGFGSALTNFTQLMECITESNARGSFNLPAGGGGAAAGGLFLDLGSMFLFAIGVLTAIIVVVLSLLVYVSKFVKMILLTVGAPIIFAIAAIPGQENRIGDWFKDMLAASLALPAVTFFLVLGGIITLSTWGTQANIPGADQYVSVSYRAMVSNVLFITMGIAALKAPGMIEAAIKGPKRR